MAADPFETLAGSLAQVRAAIIRIVAQRDAAERRYGSLVVGRAQLSQVLRDQRGYLARSCDEIDRARELARRAADLARTAATDATPYEQTITALDREAQILAAAGAQLADADAAADENMARARALVADNRERLDASLREQLALLARLEKLERKAQIARRYE